ncbi:hypothetical protein [Methylocaldum gracile]|nr:hypothetical protein [Methylocaldum sp. BRCS4]
MLAHVRKPPVVFALALGLGLSPAGHAAIWKATLNQSNAESVFPDNADYLTVFIRDGSDAAGLLLNGYTTTSDDVVFSVDALSVLDSKAGTNYGIDTFAFNTTLNPGGFTANNFKLPSGWSLGSGNADGFGDFELKTDGGGQDRYDPVWFAITGINGDNASHYFALSGKNAGQGNYYFAAHVAGFNEALTGGTGGAWFAGSNGQPGTAPEPVPVPAAFWLFGSAVAGFAFASRHSKPRLV